MELMLVIQKSVYQRSGVWFMFREMLKADKNVRANTTISYKLVMNRMRAALLMSHLFMFISLKDEFFL